MLQEISLEPSIRPEKQRALAVNISSIQVRNRHRRSAYGRLTIHLCIVLSGGNFIGVAQEQTRNREAAVSPYLPQSQTFGADAKHRLQHREKQI